MFYFFLIFKPSCNSQRILRDPDRFIKTLQPPKLPGTNSPRPDKPDTITKF